MPPAKPDRRTERSRAALMSAFVQIMLAEGYEAITVERVAERANVGRSTFYMHYTGKEDILRQAMARPGSILAVLVGNTLPSDILVKQLDHFYEQRRRNHVFFAGQVRAIWIKSLAELIEPRLASVIRHTRARPVLPPALIALQIAELHLSLIANWLGARTPTKTESVAEAMVTSTNAMLAALLRVKPETSLTIPGERLRFQEA